LLSCAHAVAPAPVSDANGPWYGDLHALAAEAAQVRGMTLTQSFEVLPVGDAAFFEIFGNYQKAKQGELLRDLIETFNALSLVKTGLAALRGVTRQQANALRDEQLIAFYLFEEHRLYVRATLPPSLAKESDKVRSAILAHEVGHVLQDQRGLFKLDVSSLESVMAFRAALEGDATLTATLLMARRNGLAPERGVERGRFALANLGTRGLLELSGGSPALLESAPMLRELIVFPYLQGQAFVADLYAAGGLPLVDAMLKAQPRHTDAIWMPQRWLDGKGARIDAVGPTPHKLGTFLAKGLLEQCGQSSGAPVPPELLGFVSLHLLDDSFQRTGDTLVWATAWDDETAKPDPDRTREQAKDVLTRLATCIGAQPGSFEVTMEGPVAVLGVGAPDEARRVARLPLLPAVAPSLGMGIQRVPPPRREVAYKSAGAGEVVGGQWVHKRLGLSLDGMEGVKLSPGPVTVLTLIAPGAVLRGYFVDEPVSEKSANALFNVSLDASLKGAKLGPKMYPLGIQHTWRALKWGSLDVQVTDELAGDIPVRGIAVPLCGGKATFYVMALAVQPRGRPRLDSWTAGWKVNSPAPICSEQ
jgi:hypothetical protein